jgi:hypothetical protein
MEFGEGERRGIVEEKWLMWESELKQMSRVIPLDSPVWPHLRLFTDTPPSLCFHRDY